MKALLLKK